MKNVLKKALVILFIILFMINSFAYDLSNVNFTIDGSDTELNTKVVEDTDFLKKIGKEHSEKYYAYYGTKVPSNYDFVYRDVTGLTHKMLINKNALYNNINWDKKVRKISKSLLTMIFVMV